MNRSRRAPILAALYALPAAAWVVVARAVVPPLIHDAYHGRSWPLLNRVFQRRIPHPFEHYLDLWRWAWQALLLGWLFHLLVVLVILEIDRRQDGERSPEQTRDARTLNRWLIAFSLAFLLVTVVSGPRHDYVAFLEMWTEVLAGRDPWWIHPKWGYPLNAYGPLFNILALPAWLNPMAPKLLFALAYCLFTVIFLKRPSLNERPLGVSESSPPPNPPPRWGRVGWGGRGVTGSATQGGMGQPATGQGGFPMWGILAWLWSPFPWVEIAYFGHFDVLVAIACVAAVALMLRGRDFLAGASLAIGFLLKLIPVVIVPFFALDGRRVRVRLLAGAGVPMVLGYGMSFMLWGPTTFRPFTFAYERGSTLLSIFRYLRGKASPLRVFQEHPNLDAWSTPSLAVAGLFVFLICQWRRAEPSTSALVAVLTTLLFYQVGFIQYQMILFLLMAFWLGRYAPVLAQQRGLALAIGGYFGWLSLFDLFYAYAGGVMHADGPWGWVADRVGLPTFLLGSFLLVNLLRVAGRL